MKKIQSRALTGLAAGTIGAAAIAGPFIAKWEGLRQWAYLDPVQVPTICYGSTAGVRMGQYKTEAECGVLLMAEIDYFAGQVNKYVHVSMPETRRAALISFTYNVGVQNFRQSTMLKKLNKGQVRAACDEMLRWVYAKGRKLPGLVTRRKAERDLCLQGYEEGSPT